MKFEEFRKHLHDNNIYLNSTQSYVELYDIFYHKSDRVTNEDVVAELNNLELHYYPKKEIDVLRGISQNGGKEVIISNEKIVNNYYKKTISFTDRGDSIHKIFDLTKNQSLRCVGDYPELYKVLRHYCTLNSEYFDKRKAYIKYSNYMKNYKFPFKVYENKDKVFDNVYNLKDGLSKNDLIEIIHQVNGVIETSIKEYHKDKLVIFLKHF